MSARRTVAALEHKFTRFVNTSLTLHAIDTRLLNTTIVILFCAKFTDLGLFDQASGTRAIA
jgi:hypothetical protein